MSETYETEWYGEPVVCCARCHFVQFGAESRHVAWCDSSAEAVGPTRDPR